MTEADSSALSETEPRRSWWRRWLVDPIRNQLLQGVSSERIAWAAAVGVTFGIIPILGTVSFLSVSAAAIFKLNQPITHLFTRLMLPLHLGLIVPFIRLGQRIHGVDLLNASVSEMVTQFKESPLEFLNDFGLAAWHGFIAWLLVAPFVLMGVKLILTPVFRYCAKRAKRSKGGIA